jgi:RHS repeat-associated protein
LIAIPDTGAADSEADVETPTPLESPPPEPTKPTVLSGDFSLPSPSASLADRTFPELKPGQGFDPARSVREDAKTTATAEHFINPDGTRTARIATAPVRFKGIDGAWHDYDLRLQTADKVAPDSPLVDAPRKGVVDSPGDLVARSSDKGASLSDEPAKGLGRVAVPAGSITVGVPDVAGTVGQPTVKTDDPVNARYSGGRAGVSVHMALTTGGLKQSVVVDSRSGPSEYRLPIALPPGVSARAARNGLEFIDTSGAVVATFGGGFAFDSAEHPSSALVTSSLEAVTGGIATVRVAVGEKWFADEDRKFPVTIDPPLWIGVPPQDTYVNSANQNGTYGGSHVLHAGGFGLSGELDHMLLKYSGLPPAESNIAVFDAKIRAVASGGGMSTAAKQMTITPVYSNFEPSTVTWASHPTLDGSLPATTATVPAGTSQSTVWMDVTALVNRQMSTNNPSWGVGVMVTATNELTDWNSGKHFWSNEMANAWGVDTEPYLDIVYRHRPNQLQANDYESPVPNGTVASLTPTLRAHLPSPISPDGPNSEYPDAEYSFKVASGPDANSGTLVAQSEWYDAEPNTDLSWTVPQGFLQNGGTYYWAVQVYDGVIWNLPTVTAKFKVDLRLGETGPSPFDELGPATVNLATGNVHYSTKSQTFPSVAGDLGLTYSYNSMAPSDTGLSGEYYGNIQLTGNPVAVKRDTRMAFDWHGEPPHPGMLASNWGARWSGYVTVPPPDEVGGDPGDNNWIPMVSSHAGVKIWINNVVVYDTVWDPVKWDYGTFHGGSSFNLAPNTPVAIRIEYFEDNTAPGALDVRLRPVAATFNKNVHLPLGGDWLSVAAPALPKGWNVSPDVDGSTPYTRLVHVSNIATLIAPDGRVDRFTWYGGYIPDPGLNATLTFTCGGGTCWWDFNGGGTRQRFNPDGTLAWSRSALDDRQPAAAQYTWTTPTSTSPARLTSITDPVSNRAIRLRYAGHANCPTPPSGYDSAPPSGMLCRVEFTEWGGFGGNSDFFYQSGRLGQIRGLGSSGIGYDTTTFAYTGGGRLARVREPLANDQYGSFSTDQPDTVIAYDGEARASWVKTPEPKPVQGSPNENSRQKHTYTYTPATNTATVKGLLPGPVTKIIETVTWDAEFRQLTSTDATGHTTSQAWDASADAVESATDAAGLRTTTVRDAQHRPTHTYGPAPVSWFNGLLPGAGHGDGQQNPMPHAQTVYDLNLNGLDAAWWNSNNLTGNPVLHTFWVGSGGEAWQDWGSGSPGTGVNADNFSGQLSGEVNIPAAGPWYFKVIADDGAQVFVDDQLVVNNWEIYVPGGTESTVALNLSAGWHRFRVSFQEKAGGAKIDLQYKLGGYAWARIPVANLIPRYDLVTRTTNPDGHAVDTLYQSYSAPDIGPQYKLPVYTSVAPGSLGLLSATTYESPGTNKYFRPLTTTPPRGTIAGNTKYDTTKNWYGATTTRDFPTVTGCPTGDDIPQGGLLKETIDPDPDDTAGPAVPTEHETIYNNQGRPAFTLQADGAWSCNQYDARLRVTKNIATDGKVTDYNYNTPGTVNVTYTDSGGTSRSTSSTVDLLGRTTSYTDEQGTVTRTVYDIAGRVSATYRTLPGGSEAQLASATYDDDGRVLTSTEYVSTPSGRTSTTAYDIAGRPTTFDRPTTTYPVRTTTSYDANTGRTSALTTSRNGVTQWTDSLIYTLAGKISIDWATNVLRTFAYDNANRLVTTSENGALARQYAFDANTNRCDIGTTSVACSSPAYTYNYADQLTASPIGGNYVYDNRGRLDTYTKAGGGTVNIDYDANDHAKRIDDGSTRVDETLDPGGRVLRRVVTSPPGGTVTEDTTFGYAGGGDSPSWARPTGGGTYTTYLGGVIVTGTTPKYQIANPHGDIIGTTDQNGTFTTNPTTDEYGDATSIPNTRLGYLGSHHRFTTHTTLGIIRMGVRLYQPGLGRFLQQDPVEGGSCNDYDYVCSDPVNGLDLDGKYFNAPSGWVMAWAWARYWKSVWARRVWNFVYWRTRRGPYTVVRPPPRPAPKLRYKGTNLAINVGGCALLCFHWAYSRGHVFHNFGIGPEASISASVQFREDAIKKPKYDRSSTSMGPTSFECSAGPFGYEFGGGPSVGLGWGGGCHENQTWATWP